MFGSFFEKKLASGKKKVELSEEEQLQEKAVELEKVNMQVERAKTESRKNKLLKKSETLEADMDSIEGEIIGKLEDALGAQKDTIMSIYENINAEEARESILRELESLPVRIQQELEVNLGKLSDDANALRDWVQKNGGKLMGHLTNDTARFAVAASLLVVVGVGMGLPKIATADNKTSISDSKVYGNTGISIGSGNSIARKKNASSELIDYGALMDNMDDAEGQNPRDAALKDSLDGVQMGRSVSKEGYNEKLINPNFAAGVVLKKLQGRLPASVELQIVGIQSIESIGDVLDRASDYGASDNEINQAIRMINSITFE